MSEKESLNQQLYEKMSAEQDGYREWLTSQPPEEILHHAYEYATREDILMAVEYMDLPEEQAKALLGSPAPLDEIYNDFEQIEGDHMDIIRECIETRANDILEKQNGKSAFLPVYQETGAYAREHGELEAYRESAKLNRECAQAISDYIRDNYRNNSLDDSGVKDVIGKFGAERVQTVLANTIQNADWDGRYSRDNKAWANTFPKIPENAISRISNHPCLVDGFTNIVRRQLREAEKQSVMDKLKSSPKQEVKPKTKAPDKGIDI